MHHTPLAPRSYPPRHHVTACLGLLALAAGTLNAQTVLLNETFASATVSGLVVTGATTWRPTLAGATTSASLVTDSTTGPNEGSADKALSLTPASSANSYLGTFTATTLAIGQTLTLRLDARYSVGTNTGVASGFRIGLFNSNGTGYTAGTADTFDDNDPGYRVNVPYNLTATSPTVGKEAGTNGSAGGGTDFTALTATISNVNLRTTSTRFTLTATRSSSTQVDLDLLVNGTSIASTAIIDNSSPFFTFDEVMIGSGAGSGNVYLVDNVYVEASPIPEPSASALLLSGAAGLLTLAFRRRKRG